jgi:hypothetical protein
MNARRTNLASLTFGADAGLDAKEGDAYGRRVHQGFLARVTSRRWARFRCVARPVDKEDSGFVEPTSVLASVGNEGRLLGMGQETRKPTDCFVGD